MIPRVSTFVECRTCLRAITQIICSILFGFSSKVKAALRISAENASLYHVRIIHAAVDV